MKMIQLIQKNCSPGDFIKESIEADLKEGARDSLDHGKTSLPLAAGRKNLEPLERETCSPGPRQTYCIENRIPLLSISYVSVISTIDCSTELSLQDTVIGSSEACKAHSLH